MAGPGVVVAGGASRVSLLGAELVANRVRARGALRLILPGGVPAVPVAGVLRAHAADGSLATAGVTARAGAGDVTPQSAARLAATLHGTGIAAAAAPAAEAGVDLAVVDARPVATALAAASLAAEVVVLAAGDEDAEAVATLTTAPALTAHPAATVVCDPPAARRLPASPAATSDRVVIVLGHREPGVSAEHRISAHSRARMFRAEEVCLEDPVRAAILSGYTSTGGLSEAEQMAREWTVPGVAALTEVAGRDTAENASRSLPLVLALGGIRRVAVVTSPWHVRAPYFFAPYRDYGLRLEWRPGRPLRRWRHLLAHEVEEAPRMRRERAAAMRAVRIVAAPSVS